MDTPDIVATVIGSVGLILGIWNAVWNSQQVKTRIEPKLSFMLQSGEDGFEGLNIEIVNKSPFQITVRKISFLATTEELSGQIPYLLHSDSSPQFSLPKRIESKDTADFLMRPSFHKLPEFEYITEMEITTGDGQVFKFDCFQKIKKQAKDLVKFKKGLKKWEDRRA